VQTMIEVGEGPEADFTAAIMGNTVQFTDASDGASSWSWTFGDGAVSSEQNPVHTYAQTGNFSVTLVVTNECGTATYSEQIAILAVMPVANFTAETQEGCVPLTVQFVDLSQNDPTAWNWTFQGGTPSTSTEQNPVVVYNNPGEFNVTLQVTNLAGTNSLVQNQYILVSGLPVANFLYDADLGVVSFTNTSTGGQTYDWDFGDGGSSASPSPTHIYQESGMYTVVLTVTNDCGSVQYEETIEVFVTSVEELAFLDRFVLFPNPNDGHYTLELSGRPNTDGPIRLRWTNLLGQTLGETEIDFHSGAYRESFDQQDWPRGVYLLQLQAGQQTTFRKVVFQ
ncbi:MAG: PKD domain-containing protein, partial [Saprospiraceae bacterium]|nr:PKD domain-containing protein [Saprospiraceae bacterium]